MQKIVAGLMALTAMGASVLADVDPLGIVGRGAVAYVIGMLLASIWTMVTNPQEAKKKGQRDDSEATEEVESNESNEDDDEEEAA